MFAKLNAIALAALIAAPAFAGQPSGRDSVYAGTEATAPRPTTATVNPIPFGRDSVYATGVKSTKPISAEIVFRPGRA